MKTSSSKVPVLIFKFIRATLRMARTFPCGNGALSTQKQNNAIIKNFMPTRYCHHEREPKERNG